MTMTRMKMKRMMMMTTTLLVMAEMTVMMRKNGRRTVRTRCRGGSQFMMHRLTGGNEWSSVVRVKQNAIYEDAGSRRVDLVAFFIANENGSFKIVNKILGTIEPT